MRWDGVLQNAERVARAWITLCKLQKSILPTWDDLLQRAEGVSWNMDHTLQRAGRHPDALGRRSAVRSAGSRQHRGVPRGSRIGRHGDTGIGRHSAPSGNPVPPSGGAAYSQLPSAVQRALVPQGGRGERARVPSRSMNVRVLRVDFPSCIISCWRCSSSWGARPGLNPPSLSPRQTATGALPPRRGSSRSIVGIRAETPCGSTATASALPPPARPRTSRAACS